MSAIRFDPKLAHVLGFRHFSRAQVPLEGDVWDFDMGLAPGAAVAARRVRTMYLPHVVPAALIKSPVSRTGDSLALLWPELASRITKDSRLGIERGEEHLWARLDALPDAYNVTPQQAYVADPDIMEKSARAYLDASFDAVKRLGAGGIVATCSHAGIADCAARMARLGFGVTENDGWLPGKGFESGGFVHLAYYVGALVHCQYYPVPAE